MRKRKLLVVLAGLATLLAVGAFVVWSRSSKITHENFDRLRPGMTRAEVEEILGPSGSYEIGSWQGVTADEEHDTFGPHGKEAGGDSYESESKVVWLKFDEADKLDSGTFIHVTNRGHEDLLAKCLRRAKQQWRRWFPE